MKQTKKSSKNYGQIPNSNLNKLLRSISLKFVCDSYRDWNLGFTKVIYALFFTLICTGIHAQKFDVDEFHIPEELSLSNSEYEQLSKIGKQLREKLVAELQAQGYDVISPRRSKIRLERVGIDDIKVDYDSEANRVIFGKLLVVNNDITIDAYLYGSENGIRDTHEPLETTILSRQSHELNDPEEINMAVRKIIAGLSLDLSDAEEERKQAEELERKKQEQLALQKEAEQKKQEQLELEQMKQEKLAQQKELERKKQEEIAQRKEEKRKKQEEKKQEQLELEQMKQEQLAQQKELERKKQEEIAQQKEEKRKKQEEKKQEQLELEQKKQEQLAQQKELEREKQEEIKQQKKEEREKRKKDDKPTKVCSKAPGAAFIVAGGLMGGTGIYLRIKAKNIYDDDYVPNFDESDARDVLEEARKPNRMAHIIGAGGILTAGIGAYLWARCSKKRKNSNGIGNVQITPHLEYNAMTNTNNVTARISFNF